MEALASVNQFGVCELRKDELMEVDGGVDWLKLAAGCASIVAGAISPDPFTTAACIYAGADMVMDACEDAPSQQN